VLRLAQQTRPPERTCRRMTTAASGGGWTRSPCAAGSTRRAHGRIRAARADAADQTVPVGIDARREELPAFWAMGLRAPVIATLRQMPGQWPRRSGRIEPPVQADHHAPAKPRGRRARGHGWVARGPDPPPATRRRRAKQRAQYAGRPALGAKGCRIPRPQSAQVPWWIVRLRGSFRRWVIGGSRPGPVENRRPCCTADTPAPAAAARYRRTLRTTACPGEARRTAPGLWARAPPRG
jgi:hypothetical protein